MNPTLEFKISQLPESPGVYQMKRAGEIIYVGCLLYTSRCV